MVMSTKVRQGQRKRRQPTLSQTNVSSLFWAMACDLKLHSEPCVQKAYSLLKGGKYVSFLAEAGSWVSQLQDPSPGEYARWSQLANILKKFPFNDSSIDRRKAALAKFLKSEHRCMRFNAIHRLRRASREKDCLAFMRRWISETLGPFHWSQVFKNCDFGPGMSIGCNRSDLSFQGKLAALTCTPALVPVVSAALLHNTHYMASLTEGKPYCIDADWVRDNVLTNIDVRQYNKIGFVPKTATEHRTIATPLTLNGFIQKGIGSVVINRLRSIGIDLKDQSRNQHFARLGSLHGNWSTIDLSSASDSISIELVRSLLPDDWFAAMNIAREPAYLLNGYIFRYEKFCAMGNGFCFPLQTLIFASVAAYARSVAHRGAFCVYGDDIIVPTGNYLLVKEILEYIGFRLNVSKSYAFGPFRESCGADYHCGVQVRSIYIDKPVSHPANMYPLLNHLYMRKHIHTWEAALKLLPEKWKLFGPPQHGDDSYIRVPQDIFMSSVYSEFDRHTMSWSWLRAVSVAAPGMSPRTEATMIAGKLRGDLTESDTFSVRGRTRFVRMRSHVGDVGPETSG